MYFDSLSAALAMDGHGAYVWGAYGLSLLVLLVLIVLPRRRRLQFLRELRGEQRRARLTGAAVEQGFGEEQPGSVPPRGEVLNNADASAT